MRQLVKSGRFICYVIARGVSVIGANLAAIVLGFAVLSVGGNAFGVGIVLAASYVAQTLTLPIAGLLADRIPRRTLASLSNLSLAGVQLAMGSILIFSPQVAEVWTFAVAGVVTGVAGAAARPAYEGMLVELVSPESLQPANAILHLVQNIARVAVPGSGALIAAVFGYGPVLLAAGIAFAICAGMLLTLPRGYVNQEPPAWRRDLREGAVAFVGRPWLALYLAHGAVTVPLWLAAYQLLGPVIMENRPSGLERWGWAVSAFTGGLILGTLVAMWWRPQRLMLATTFCLVLWPLPLPVLVLDVHLAWLLLAMLLSGVALDLAIVFSNTARQQHVPQQLIGRVSSISQAGEVALVPFAYLIGGYFAVVLGPGPIMWACAIGMLVATIGLFCARSIRHLRRVDDGSRSLNPAQLAGRAVA